MKVNKKLLPIGISDFIKIRQEGYYFVDKSLLIKQLINSGTEVTLFARPRRFGKTLNMSMIKAFFEISNFEFSRLFEDLEIWQCRPFEKYRGEQGRYPVIFLTLKDIKCNNWKDTFEKLKNVIKREYNRHIYLFDSDQLTQYDKDYMRHILDMSATSAEWQDSLIQLTAYLKSYYRIAPILLIDEYDIPIQQGYLNGFYEQIIEFMRNWLSGGLKDNPNLKFAVLTGILHIAQESIFSGLNNLEVCTVLDPNYNQYFGFTSNEIEKLSKYYGCPEKLSELKEWYDGYTFGGLDIYNPWSIIKYIRSGYVPAPYWISTSSNDLIKQMLKNSSEEVKRILKDLLDEESYVTELNTQIVYPTIFEKPSNLFSFLVMTGYLKADRQDYGEGFIDFSLRIPNREIANVYKEEILSCLAAEGNEFLKTALDLRRALFKGDVKALDILLHQIIEYSISFYDTKESFYHGWMLALTSLFYDSHYVRSNRETGKGRYDIMMEPKYKNLPGIIFEFKVLSNEAAKNEDVQTKLQHLAEEALKQINSCNYEQELSQRNISPIIKYGIAFYKKELAIAKGST